MSKKKKVATDWDKSFEFAKNAPEFNIENATCTLIKPMPDVSEMILYHETCGPEDGGCEHGADRKEF